MVTLAPELHRRCKSTVTVLVHDFKTMLKLYGSFDPEVTTWFPIGATYLHKQRTYTYDRDHEPHRKSYSMLFH